MHQRIKLLIATATGCLVAFSAITAAFAHAVDAVDSPHDPYAQRLEVQLGHQPAQAQALGPRWARPGFTCAPDPEDPEGRGGPPWVCGPGGVTLSGDPLELWEAHRGPRWARPGFQCASDPADPEGRGGPPWVCGPGGTQVGASGLGDSSGPGGGKGRAPRWAR
jgi:hypothetical protein